MYELGSGGLERREMDWTKKMKMIARLWGVRMESHMTLSASVDTWLTFSEKQEE